VPVGSVVTVEKEFISEAPRNRKAVECVLNLYLHVQYVNALAERLLNFRDRAEALRIGSPLFDKWVRGYKIKQSATSSHRYFTSRSSKSYSDFTLLN